MNRCVATGHVQAGWMGAAESPERFRSLANNQNRAVANGRRTVASGAIVVVGETYVHALIIRLRLLLVRVARNKLFTDQKCLRQPVGDHSRRYFAALKNDPVVAGSYPGIPVI